MSRQRVYIEKVQATRKSLGLLVWLHFSVSFYLPLQTINHQDQLSPWVVYRLLPSCQRLMMERFRKRNDAEEYLNVIRRMHPGEQFEIVFEVEPEPLRAENQSRAIALFWLQTRSEGK